MIRRAIAVLATTFLLAGCASHPPKALHQGDASFKANLETYAVKYHPVGADHNTRHIFDEAVHPAMQAKGYRQVDEASAQMIINFKALTKSEAAATKTGAAGSAELEGVSGEAVDKVVMISIEQASNDEIMWVGWSTGYYAEEEILPKTKEAINRILALVPKRAAGAAPPAETPPAPATPPGS